MFFPSRKQAFIKLQSTTNIILQPLRTELVTARKFIPRKEKRKEEKKIGTKMGFKIAYSYHQYYGTNRNNNSSKIKFKKQKWLCEVKILSMDQALVTQV